MLTTTTPRLPAARRADRTRLRCPSCKYPMVGTRQTAMPLLLQSSASRCMTVSEVTTRMASTYLAVSHPVEPEMARPCHQTTGRRRSKKKREGAGPSRFLDSGWIDLLAQELHRGVLGGLVVAGLVGGRFGAALVGGHQVVGQPEG